MAESREFNTCVEWCGKNTCEAYVGEEKESRCEIIPASESKEIEGTWSPLDMLCTSLASCVLLTFVYYMNKNKIGLLDHKCKVKGDLVKGANGYVFTRFKIQLDITVKKGDREKTEEAVHLALRFCPVSNSLTAEKELVYEIKEKE